MTARRESRTASAGGAAVRAWGLRRWRRYSRLGLELVIVFVGVLGAFLVEGFRERRARAELARQIYGGLYGEVRGIRSYTDHVVGLLDGELASFDSAYAAGLRPVPVYFRIEGSEQPPSGAYTAALAAQTAGLLEPRLLLEVSTFYNEMTGMSDRFVRYATFTESRLLPYLDDHRAAFYEPGTARLKPEYAAHIERLREFRDWWAAGVDQADLLLPRLAEAAGGIAAGGDRVDEAARGRSPGEARTTAVSGARPPRSR